MESIRPFFFRGSDVFFASHPPVIIWSSRHLGTFGLGWQLQVTWSTNLCISLTGGMKNKTWTYMTSLCIAIFVSGVHFRFGHANACFTRMLGSWEGTMEPNAWPCFACKDQWPVCMSFAPVCGSQICRASAILLLRLMLMNDGYPSSHNHGSVENYPTWKETNIGVFIFHWTMIVGRRATTWQFEFLWLLLFHTIGLLSI